MLSSNPTNHKKSWLIACARRNLDQHIVKPQELRLNEVHAMLLLVGLALRLVVLKLHFAPNAYPECLVMVCILYPMGAMSTHLTCCDSGKFPVRIENVGRIVPGVVISVPALRRMREDNECGINDEGLAGRPDADVAAAAKAEERRLVTLDLDLANPRHCPSADCAGIVVLRLHTPTSKLQVRRLVSFSTTQAESVAGKLWILDGTRARDWTP